MRINWATQSFIITLFALYFAVPSFAQDIEFWLEEQESYSLTYLLENISPDDALPGTVIASPSRSNPNYYYHWVRDAALVMDTVLAVYHESDDQELRQTLKQTLNDYAELVRLHQRTSTLSGLGEPKFYVDGRGYDGPWGRPQNDGPALRAYTLTRWAQTLLTEGEDEYVQTRLFDPDNGLIITDLDYVVEVWSEPNFDLWEEVKGQHFYTLLVQKRALELGADVATQFGLEEKAQSYSRTAEQIADALEEHKDYGRGYILATLNRVDGADYKYSGLDTAVILAALHTPDDAYSVSNDWVLATAHRLRLKFDSIYSINQQYPHLGTAIGRYPEDQYYGGNPWFLATHAFAEFYFELYQEISESGWVEITSINHEFFEDLIDLTPEQTLLGTKTVLAGQPLYYEILNKLQAKADDFFRRSQFHTAREEGRMDEQLNRYSGYMESAHDLTWSYASFITALQARKRALNE